MGKAALWAGATDDRFAAVISNDSGCGGAALSKRIFGETVEIIARAFPHWFTGNFLRYAGHEADLPLDQHELLRPHRAPPALRRQRGRRRLGRSARGIPRRLARRPVYHLLGAPALDLASSNQPPVDRPVGNVLRYHVRRGPHDLTDFDWRQYLDFADRHVRGPAPGRSAATPPDSPSDAAARARRPNWSSLLSQSDAWFASPAGRGIVATVLAHQTPLGDWPRSTNTTLAPAPAPAPASAARTEPRVKGTFDNGATGLRTPLPRPGRHRHRRRRRLQRGRPRPPPCPRRPTPVRRLARSASARLQGTPATSPSTTTRWST